MSSESVREVYVRKLLRNFDSDESADLLTRLGQLMRMCLRDSQRKHRRAVVSLLKGLSERSESVSKCHLTTMPERLYDSDTKWEEIGVEDLESDAFSVADLQRESRLRGICV